MSEKDTVSALGIAGRGKTLIKELHKHKSVIVLNATRECFMVQEDLY